VIPTHRRLQYASGFIELGMLREAAKELRAIGRADQLSPTVLTVWIDLNMHARNWEQVIKVSEKLVRAEPGDDKGWISWAFALRELNQIGEARAVLLRALPLHTKTCDVLHYNLACYECLLGNLLEAKRYLKTATRKDKQWKTEAMDDPDLKELWPEIKLMKD
jgi:tetratricopeptide (TPR) repeat protein